MRVEQPLAIEEVSSGLCFEEYFPARLVSDLVALSQWPQ